MAHHFSAVPAAARARTTREMVNHRSRIKNQHVPLDDLDSRPKPIVAIPWRWSWWLLCSVPVLLMALAALLLMADPGKTRQAQPHGTIGLTTWIAALWPPAVILVVLIPTAIWMSRAPQFAAFPEGIKVNIERIPPGRSLWDPWAYGFYSWDEVSHCRWSPYRPSVLSIHLAATEQEAAGLPGTGSDRLMRVPPMIYFYRVPERYRAEVEAAIRACGKWAD
jgi:hypothetical protein